jgi:hypothetical protein
MAVNVLAYFLENCAGVEWRRSTRDQTPGARHRGWGTPKKPYPEPLIPNPEFRPPWWNLLSLLKKRELNQKQLAVIRWNPNLTQGPATAEWEKQKRPRHLLGNILKRQVEVGESQRNDAQSETVRQ